jgi:hypothetical protein
MAIYEVKVQFINTIGFIETKTYSFSNKAERATFVVTVRAKAIASVLAQYEVNTVNAEQALADLLYQHKRVD